MFILLPVGVNYRTQRLPIVTLSLIALNTLIWLVTLIGSLNTGGESDRWILHQLWLTPAKSFWWTYVTSMFVHAGFFHLFGNMIFLFLFGCCVEDLIGRWRYLVFYLVSGYVAELTYIAASPEHFYSAVPMGGASGAISGCLAMYLLLRANADIEFKYFLWFFYIRAGDFEVPAWVAISFWFLKDLFWMILGYADHQTGGGVAFGAHVGGFLAGLGLVAVYKWYALPREQAAEEPAEPAAGPVRVAVPARAAPAETPTIYLHDGAQQLGPFTLAQVQAMLHCGSLGPNTLYWSDGMSEWQSVSELAGQPLA